MKKYLKVTIILVVILTFYSIIVFVISNKDNDKTPTENPGTTTNPTTDTSNQDTPKEESPQDIVIKNPDYNIVIYPNNIISYKNGVWAENRELKTTNLLFDVYVNNNSLGKKFLTYNEKWNIYENENGYKNFLNYDGELLAINTSKTYNVYNFTFSELDETDKTVISSYLTESGITFNYDDLIKLKIIYDVNRDGMRDELYFVSNAFTEQESAYNKAFSVGFVKYYNSTEAIYTTIEDISKNLSICSSYLQNIIEIDSNLYLIVGCTYFSNQGTQHIIYEANSNGITQVIKTSTNN